MPRVVPALVTIALCLAGCTGGARQLSSLPPAWDEQREAILEVVPLGTDREEVAARLQDAGVEFSPSGISPEWTPGMRSSIFYCDRWSRPNGQVWPLDVALLFDEEGRLYQVRRAQAETGLVEDLPPSPSS